MFTSLKIKSNTVPLYFLVLQLGDHLQWNTHVPGKMQVSVSDVGTSTHTPLASKAQISALVALHLVQIQMTKNLFIGQGVWVRDGHLAHLDVHYIHGVVENVITVMVVVQERLHCAGKI